MLIDYKKSEELYERVLEGKEAQLGKDHQSTQYTVENFKVCLVKSGNMERLVELTKTYTN